jgi:hypothetical protein
MRTSIHISSNNPSGGYFSSARPSVGMAKVKNKKAAHRETLANISFMS